MGFGGGSPQCRTALPERQRPFGVGGSPGGGTAQIHGSLLRHRDSPPPQPPSPSPTAPRRCDPRTAPPHPSAPPPVPDPLEGLRGRLFSGGGGGGISFRPDTETGNPGGGGAGRGHAHLGGGAKAERAWLERSAPLLVGGDCEAGVARLRGVASGRLGAVWRGKGRGLREGAWPRGTAGESPAEIGGISPNLGDFHPKMGGGPKGGGEPGGGRGSNSAPLHRNSGLFHEISGRFPLWVGISHQIRGVLTEFGDFAPKLGEFHPKLGIFR